LTSGRDDLTQDISMVWERDGDCFVAAVENDDGRPVWHLVVEPLLSGGWDWTIWRPGDLAGTALRRPARTVQDAMQAAEQAAR
jgi:hypothetical protein